ncbi:D-alanyl-D-alanine carboxypeptidase family protein [Cytobacillus pseudoceanisediminis]|uniref:D-alanyl-D-alanine carboxypeptidase family protein n=1 Tax=Cytobacillus pseudoceanisediminis TaxID=3051614 RepID=UPI00365933C3
MKQVIVLIFIASLFSGFPKTIHASDSPVVSSGSAILIDANTGEVLFEKKATEEMYPASLTKIATAIYAIEKGNLNDIVTIGSNPRKIEGTRVYLEEGERVSLRKLIQGLIINSGNDAGVAIAEHMDGSIKGYRQHFDIKPTLIHFLPYKKPISFTLRVPA